MITLKICIDIAKVSPNLHPVPESDTPGKWVLVQNPSCICCTDAVDKCYVGKAFFALLHRRILLQYIQSELRGELCGASENIKRVLKYCFEEPEYIETQNV